MIILSMCLGATLGIFMRNWRALFAIVPFLCLLIVDATQTAHFDTWLGGILWFAGNLACFEVSCIIAAISVMLLSDAKDEVEVAGKFAE